MKPSPTRRALGIAAQELREPLHYSKLGDSISLSRASNLTREMGLKLDEFFLALGCECGAAAFGRRDEPFYDLCDEIATRFDERRRELEAAEDDDPRMSRGCFEVHNAR